jgi:NitT/TauT family transport system substrate-binding protein
VLKSCVSGRLRMSRQRAGIVGVTAALLVVAAGCGNSGSETSTAATGGGGTESTQVRVAYVPALASIAVFVASQEGFFADRGLDVELTASQNLGTFAPGLGRQYDIAFGTPVDTIVAAGRGLDIVGVAGGSMDTEDHQILQTVAGKDTGITSIEQLSGKTVGVITLAGTQYVALLSQLLEAGVDPKSVTFREVALPNQLDQLKAGRLDAAASVEPFVAQQLAAGHTSLGDPALSVDDPARSGLWISSRDWAATNPEAIAKWRDAMTQAFDFIEKRPAEARAILEESLKLPAGATKNIPLPAFDIDLTAAQLQPWIDALDKTGVLPEAEAPDPATLVVEGP